jgi:hypothetical protein
MSVVPKVRKRKFRYRKALDSSRNLFVIFLSGARACFGTLNNGRQSLLFDVNCQKSHYAPLEIKKFAGD